jgi:hypothetical protein
MGMGYTAIEGGSSGVKEFTMTTEFMFLSAVPLTLFPFLISVLML